jgi:hypothetical protein
MSSAARSLRQNHHAEDLARLVRGDNLAHPKSATRFCAAAACASNATAMLVTAAIRIKSEVIPSVLGIGAAAS